MSGGMAVKQEPGIENRDAKRFRTSASDTVYLRTLRLHKADKIGVSITVPGVPSHASTYSEGIVKRVLSFYPADGGRGYALPALMHTLLSSEQEEYELLMCTYGLMCSGKVDDSRELVFEDRLSAPQGPWSFVATKDTHGLTVEITAENKDALTRLGVNGVPPLTVVSQESLKPYAHYQICTQCIRCNQVVFKSPVHGAFCKRCMDRKVEEYIEDYPQDPEKIQRYVDSFNEVRMY